MHTQQTNMIRSNMQTSVRANPPRRGEPPRTFSDDSIHIGKKISIHSSRASTPVTTIPPPLHIERPQSAIAVLSPFNNNGKPQIFRFNSVSNSSEKLSLYPRTSMVRRRSSGEHDILESNRESMKALSEFLMNRDPPPENWVSRDSSEEESTLSSFKWSAYKLLGRSKSKKKKKKAKAPKLLLLPDSAVAARTTGGARHIAISIPLVHDHVDLSRPRTATVTPTQPRLEVQRPRSVHVLKPVHEDGEARVFNYSPSNLNGQAAGVPTNVVENKNKNKPDINPLAVHPPDQALPQSPTLGETKFTSIMDRPRALARTEPSNIPKYDARRSQRSYVAVSPTAMQRQDSQLSDPRHSGGTMYSTISLSTPQTGHSRQQSSVSTAPSATATQAKFDLPARKSSISHVPRNIQTELASASAKLEQPETGTENDKNLDISPHSPMKQGNESFVIARSSPTPPLITIGTAEIARKYDTDGPTRVRSTPPKSVHKSPRTPPPNRELPELPAGAGPTSKTPRPCTAPSQVAETDIRTKRSFSTQEQVKGTSTSRQERVKTRKQRDIEALRAARSPLAETNINRDATTTPVAAATQTRQSRAITPPSRNPKRNGMSSSERRRLANTVTPIMLVANLPPYPSRRTSHSPPRLAEYGNKTSSSSTSTIRASPPPAIKVDRDLKVPKKRGLEAEDTPPHSPVTPLPSDFPAIPNHYSSRPSPTPPLASVNHSLSQSQSGGSSENEHSSAAGGRRQSLRPSILSTRRQERRQKRNASLREQELDARLQKIERDNEVLIRTLSGIAGVLAQSRFSPSSALASRHRDALSDREYLALRDREVVGDREDIGEALGLVDTIPLSRCSKSREREKERRGELRGLEPFMRELQERAPRVSGEEAIGESSPVGAVAPTR